MALSGDMEKEKELAVKVRQALDRLPELDGEAIEVNVKNQRVVLSGCVASFEQKQAAGQTAAELPDVAQVVNELSVGLHVSDRNDPDVPTPDSP